MPPHALHGLLVGTSTPQPLHVRQTRIVIAVVVKTYLLEVFVAERRLAALDELWLHVGEPLQELCGFAHCCCSCGLLSGLLVDTHLVPGGCVCEKMASTCSTLCDPSFATLLIL